MFGKDRNYNPILGLFQHSEFPFPGPKNTEWGTILGKGNLALSVAGTQLQHRNGSPFPFFLYKTLFKQGSITSPYKGKVTKTRNEELSVFATHSSYH